MQKPQGAQGIIFETKTFLAMEKPELHNLIERYFDGETTLEEETSASHFAGNAG